MLARDQIQEVAQCTYSEGRTLNARGRGIGSWHFDLVGEDMTHQAGRRHQGRSQSSVETHGDSLLENHRERKRERRASNSLFSFFLGRDKYQSTRWRDNKGQQQRRQQTGRKVGGCWKVGLYNFKLQAIVKGGLFSLVKDRSFPWILRV